MQPGSSKDAPRARRSIRVLVISAALVAALGIPAAALAGKGGGTSSAAWIALASVTDGALAVAQPRLGTSVRFSTGYSTGTKNPWVSVSCWQGDTMVYGQGGAPSTEFGLGGASSLWLDVGGAATCRAELGDLYWRGGKQYYTFLALTWFDAGA